MRQCGRFLICALLARASAVWAGEPDGIRMVVRSSEGRVGERVLPLVPAVEVEAYDAQYDQRFPYRGIRLADLIARYAPPPGVDTALLLFRNGMVVPLPFRDARVMARLEPFIARSMKIGEGNKGWTRRFPALTRENEDYYDARPTVFAGNKLVVRERWHPYLPANAETVFSPWMQVDSLVEIEFVTAEAWFAPLDVDRAPETHHGFELYRANCAFCHGVRGQGARFGADLVSPKPLYEQQRPFARFLHHVRYRAPDAAQHGLAMPALGYMSEADARAIWLWMQAIVRPR